MSRHVLLSKLETIRKSVFFSIIVDEYTNITNKEQFPFRIYTVDDNLEVKEDFLGFYELENIKSVTVVSAMKDILLRFNLQTYDGASTISNIMRKKSGVATKLLVEQPKVIVTSAKVTLSVWLLKILLHVVKYYETL